MQSNHLKSWTQLCIKIGMHESLKIETDRLRDLIEQNKNLLRKAFALIRAFESSHHEIEKPQSTLLWPWLRYPWDEHQGVSRACF